MHRRRTSQAPVLGWVAFAVALAAAAVAVVALVLRDRSENARADSYTHRLTFDKAHWNGSARTSLDRPFNASVRVWTDDDRLLVHLAFPALQFVVQVDGTASAGYLYTVPGTNLPRRLWPRNLIGSAAAAPCSDESGVCYAYWIGPDGSVTLKSADGGPLPALAAGHRVPPTTVVYSLPSEVVCTPQSVRLGEQSSATSMYYASDSAYDPATGLVRVAFAWYETTGVSFRSADVDADSGAIVWGPLVRAIAASAPGDLKIAVDPNDADRIALHAAVGGAATVVSVTVDGGATWSDPVAPWTESAQPWLLIDNFGNCYASARVASGAQSVRLSIDGCLTFPTEIASVGTSIDSPRIAYGPDGSGIDWQYALWLSGDESGAPIVGFLSVGGLGAHGSLMSLKGFDQIRGGTSLSQIYVAPDTGAVCFLSTNAAFARHNTIGDGLQLTLWINPNGTVGFDSAAFLPPRVVQIGNFDIGEGPLPAVGAWGYDSVRHRVYFFGSDERPAASGRAYALLAYSDSDGQTWSDEIAIDDAPSIGPLALTVEPTTGIAAAAWIARKHAYAAILRPSDLNQMCSP